MTYFLVNDPIAGEQTFFVPTQTDVETYAYLNCQVGGEAEARVKLAEVQQSFLQHQDYLFSIAKEVVDGSNTTWTAADLANDPEVGAYHVFNPISGLHELLEGLTAAKNRREEVRQEYLAHSGLVDPIVVPYMRRKPEGYSESTYGPTVGDIPVQEM